MLDLYIIATAEGDRFAFTLPNSPSTSCCSRVSRFGLLQPSRRWADDRDEMCHDRIDPCHIAGVRRLGATAAATAAETRRDAPAAKARRRAAGAETRRRALQAGRDRSGAGSRGRCPTHLARPV